MSFIAAIGTDGLRQGVIHGDFHGGNLLYSDGRITGILDFEFTYPDVCAADFASIGFLRRPAQIARYLVGYASVRPLDEREVRLVGSFVSARYLEHLAYLLAERPAATWEGVASKVRETLAAVERQAERRAESADELFEAVKSEQRQLGR